MTALRDYTTALGQPALAGGPARYDEVVGPDGLLRAAWRGFAEVAVGLTGGDLDRVDAEIRRALADDGVRYARPGAQSEPWRLDPLPLVLDAAAWSGLELGLAQRAELLNALLADLYGDQRLLAERIVPSAVVFGHQGFVRGLARPARPSERSGRRAGETDPRPLVITATDLGRDESGRWQVLADRAQAPSGIGYAAENRAVLARVLPGLAGDASLHRVEPFLQALRSALLQSAQLPGDRFDVAEPRVVVLSPGSQSETAYDQAYLASHLGFPLVEGPDLTVRDGAVWLEGFDRLERVHVILRRVDAGWSDPLELRADSRLGIAGLSEAVRRGNVRVVNGLGAGVLENPGLAPYLPAACQRLLGESLRLPSVPTWWCGDPESLTHVLDRLDDPRLSVRRIDRTGIGPLPTDPDGLRREVLAAPYRFVGQVRPVLSQAPAYDAGGMRPQSLTLRAFTLRYGSAYRPLLGGIATVFDGDRPVTTKDVWVLKRDPAEPDQGLAEVLPMTAAQTVPAVVPRVLEDMWWLGRYAERAEDLLRLVLVTHTLAEDFAARPRSAGGGALDVLLEVLTGLSEPGPTGPGPTDPTRPTPSGPGPCEPAPTDLDARFRALLLDDSRPGSAAQSLAALRDAAQAVRDQLSPDVWRAFAATDRGAWDLATHRHSGQVSEAAGRMLNGVLALYGVTANMMRDAAWHMIAAGRSLERGLQLAQLLTAVTVRRGLDVDRAVHDAVLEAAESAVTHRRRYRGYVRPANVLELLLTDRANPRSLVVSLEDVRDHLAVLPYSTRSTRPERLLEDLLRQVEELDVARLVTIGGTRRPHLEHFLADLAERLEQLAGAVAEVHLSGTPAPRAFGLGTTS